MVLIVVAIIGGIAWWMVRAREGSKRDAKEFVRQAATRLAFEHDRKFLDRVIAPDRVSKYPPSFRERLVEKLRGFGRPSAPPEVEGEVLFVRGFFEPMGNFTAKLPYANQPPATLQFAISRPKGWWQIDNVNVLWELPQPVEVAPAPPPPPPTPAASPARR